MADPVETLSRVPLLAGVGRRELKRLVERMSERTFGEGEVAVEEGRGGAGFWLIQDGNATVSISGEMIRTLGPGEYFGEIALLDDGPRTARSPPAPTCAAWAWRPGSSARSSSSIPTSL